MATGDGLLARFIPDEPRLAPSMLYGIAGAAARYGNGILEVTQRGALQVRGLGAGTVEDFAAAVEDLGVTVTGDLPVHLSPLSGIDPAERIDMRPVAASLRASLAGERLALSPKVSAVLDGGGVFDLDALPADIRLSAERDGGRVACRVSMGGTADAGMPLGLVPVADATAAVLHLLRRIAGEGPSARAKDVLRLGPSALTAGSPVHFDPAPARPRRPAGEPLGVHSCRGGKVAVGVGLAFGNCTSRSLQAILEAALSAGAEGFALAPRALVATGLPPAAAPAFRHAAAALGYIVDRADVRNRIAACPGAPACASGWIATREIAAAIAPTIGPLETVHVSGCGKGCAHPRPAGLVIVGRADGCGIAFGARADDAPKAVVPVTDVGAAVAAHRPAGEFADA